jgi:hypothetical protein
VIEFIARLIEDGCSSTLVEMIMVLPMSVFSLDHVFLFFQVFHVGHLANVVRFAVALSSRAGGRAMITRGRADEVVA